MTTQRPAISTPRAPRHAAISGWSGGGGSVSNTSRPTAPIRPSRRPSVEARRGRPRPPRAVGLTTMAPGFIAATAAASIRWRVRSSSRQWMSTMSARPEQVGERLRPARCRGRARSRSAHADRSRRPSCRTPLGAQRRRAADAPQADDAEGQLAEPADARRAAAKAPALLGVRRGNASLQATMPRTSASARVTAMVGDLGGAVVGHVAHRDAAPRRRQRGPPCRSRRRGGRRCAASAPGSNTAVVDRHRQAR